MVLGANEINGVKFPLRMPSVALGEASQMERSYHSCDATGTRVTAGVARPARDVASQCSARVGTILSVERVPYRVPCRLPNAAVPVPIGNQLILYGLDYG